MNPAAIVRNGKVYIFYRCEDNLGPTSRIGIAQSSDGLTFTRASAPRCIRRTIPLRPTNGPVVAKTRVLSKIRPERII
jgi:hypothetical protein